MQIYLRYAFRNVYDRYVISGTSPIEKRNLMLPCVLYSERKRGTYPRLKTYSDLWRLLNLIKTKRYIYKQTPSEEADIYAKAGTCAAQGAAIYGAEGICKFICDIHSETYKTDM